MQGAGASPEEDAPLVHSTAGPAPKMKAAKVGEPKARSRPVTAPSPSVSEAAR